MISASNRRPSFSPKCDITLTPGAIGWRLAKCDISRGRPPSWPFGQRKFQYSVPGCIRTAHPRHVSGPFDIHFYLPQQIDITLDRTGSRGGSSLLVVADLFRGQPFRMAFADRDDMIQQVVAMTSRWLRRKEGAIPYGDTSDALCRNLSKVTGDCFREVITIPPRNLCD